MKGAHEQETMVSGLGALECQVGPRVGCVLGATWPVPQILTVLSATPPPGLSQPYRLMPLSPSPGGTENGENLWHRPNRTQIAPHPGPYLALQSP